MNLTFEKAGRQDVKDILMFIRAIAEYENLLDEVVATEEGLEHALFDLQGAETIFAVVDGKRIGFALYYFNFSTFEGNRGLYLEDLFIFPEYRGLGFGKQLMQEVIAIANQAGCSRMEWVCLDWNQSSIDFYLTSGAKPLDKWTTYRLSQQELDGFK